ncbi:hypothetical protein BC937DRAFT_92944 [Endogone sp. FLAS-F59071]|nr:hypothetical protein BC937DRAFT_92944 [Endogone sp. FLAS-F59071]|eukprot:RUS15067.1 hypothetical protein BC937DRAFT_92944 [Endogone sp. FLAS-F59071]
MASWLFGGSSEVRRVRASTAGKYCDIQPQIGITKRLKEGERHRGDFKNESADRMVHISNPYRGHGIKAHVLAGGRGKGQFDNGFRGGVSRGY